MVYISDFDTFYEEARQLYEANPLATRYVLKYRHTDGKLVLKVTDDTVCLKYKTDQQSDLRKLERLNLMFFSLMAKGEFTPEEEMQPVASQAAPQASSKGRKQGGRRKG